MKIIGWLKERIWILFFLLTILTSILLGYVASIEKKLDFQTYNGVNADIVEKLKKEKETVNRKKLLDNTGEIKLIALKNGDCLNQKIILTTNILNAIALDINVYEKSDLEITILNENKEKKNTQRITVNTEQQQLVIPLNGLKHDKEDVFYLDVHVKSGVKEKSIALYTREVNDKNMSINQKVMSRVLVAGIEGSIVVYKEKTLVAFVVMTVVFLLLTLVLYIEKRKQNCLLQKGINCILSARWKMYGLEIVGYILIVLIGLRFYVSYMYQADLDIFIMYVFVLLTGLWSVLVYAMLKRYRYSIADIYAILAIPIGLSFVFLMLPDQVPDEQTHFAKAYLTSTFDFSNSVDVKMSVDYAPVKLHNYNDILPAIFTPGNYTDTVLFSQACTYNFLLYILPGAGLFICRILNISIYMAYYVGRILNLLLCIYVGYRCIKLVPFAKYVFFVYLFNPMGLQQAASYSSDAMVNSVMMIVIAYFLWLFAKETLLSNKDIVVVFILMAIIAICKYAYLPVFGIYLLLYKKILKMNRTQLAIFVFGIIGVAISYILMALFTGPAGKLQVMEEYMKTNHVNASEQIRFMIAHPKGTLLMLRDTFTIKMSFYIQSFVGLFSSLTVPLNVFATHFYLILMLLSPLLIEEKVKIKKIQKCWIGLIGFACMLLIIIAMYITWSPVGQGFSEGVQGRYFIPLMILVLLAYTGTKKVILKRPLRFCVVVVVLVNVMALNDVVNYFTFLA